MINLLAGFLSGLLGAIVALVMGASILQAFIAYMLIGIVVTLSASALAFWRARRRRRRQSAKLRKTQNEQMF